MEVENLLKIVVDACDDKHGYDIVAYDLTPSDTAQLNTFVKGFATSIGGKTSHSAIMANSLEIPAVVGCPGVMDAVKTGDVLALDALDGVVEVNPDEATIKAYNE